MKKFKENNYYFYYANKMGILTVLDFKKAW